jgi:flagellar protein FlaG
VVINSGSHDEGGSNKVTGGVTERRHEAIREAIAKEIAEAADQVDRSDVRVSTEVHEATGRYIVKVIEGESGKVLREFPPAEYLDVMAALEELGGTLLEEKI